jgi:hypothetical protein
MGIGIIGAGALGSNAARLLARSGLSVTIANSRGPASLAELVGALGPSIQAGTVKEAASAEIVLVAVRWVDLGKALGGLRAWNGRVVIDGTNPVAFLDPDSPDAKDPSNLEATTLGEPAASGGQRVLFYSGDDTEGEVRGPQASRTDRLFPGRSRPARRRRTTCLAAVRSACRRQLRQNLTAATRTSWRGCRACAGSRPAP